LLLHVPFLYPFNQSINQSINIPISQSVSLSVSLSICLSVYLSISRFLSGNKADKTGTQTRKAAVGINRRQMYAVMPL